MGLVAVLYRAMGLMRVWPSGRVHLCDLRDLEMRVAGVTIAGRPATVHDCLQAHATPALDLLCAVPYATFIVACLTFAVFASLRDAARGARFAWGFLLLNVIGFATYRLYPAAPPWYFHAHGCVVDLATRASEGPNLARVDGWLGFHLFAAMYARSSAVFGAMPSLHCAYALLIVLEGWALFGRWMRAVTAAYAGLMAFAAVYLDHHWILDVLAGHAYAAAVFVVMRRASAWRRGVAVQHA
jgi:membrane-associated phospholipid phosphatase